MQIEFLNFLNITLRKKLTEEAERIAIFPLPVYIIPQVYSLAVLMKGFDYDKRKKNLQ